MKKILLALGMVMIMACATTVAPKPKCDAQPPPAAPTQEEVLERVRFEAEVKGFEVWWALESVQLAGWLSERSGMKVDVELREVTFIDQYNIGMVHVFASSLIDETNLYIIITRPDGSWQIANIVVKEMLSVQPQEKKVDDHDEQL